MMKWDVSWNAHSHGRVSLIHLSWLLRTAQLAGFIMKRRLYHARPWTITCLIMGKRQYQAQGTSVSGNFDSRDMRN